MFVVVYNLNVNLEGMGLVLGQSWMVVSINGHILFYPPIIMYCEICCCLHIHSVVNVLVMGLVLGAKFDVHIYHRYPVIGKSMSPL